MFIFFQCGVFLIKFSFEEYYAYQYGKEKKAHIWITETQRATISRKTGISQAMQAHYGFFNIHTTTIHINVQFYKKINKKQYPW